MPRTVQLVLDDDLARRVEERLAAEGGDAAALLESALRFFLDAEDDRIAARESVIRAAGEGEFGAVPGLSADHARVRLWLLGWGGEGESGPPGSC
ncbi:transcriptional regulator [Magnetospirillum sp. ME-1]|uniref:transcriptional regulator n=1 Tax=Magnetospirillum sp. ME-1 TaxID=1639348 RepID=UPI000A17E129|nr:transcriptional regulator [Magnetospirillum sp. ME-1]ARJ66890.1 transcriptional regulator [Magnetospirillum sp. ME-1]